MLTRVYNLGFEKLQGVFQNEISMYMNRTNLNFRGPSPGKKIVPCLSIWTFLSRFLCIHYFYFLTITVKFNASLFLLRAGPVIRQLYLFLQQWNIFNNNLLFGKENIQDYFLRIYLVLLFLLEYLQKTWQVFFCTFIFIKNDQ